MFAPQVPAAGEHVPHLYAVAAFLVATLTSWISTPLAIRLAVSMGWFDQPDGQRRVHNMPVPRIGGLGVFAGALVAVILPTLVLGILWSDAQLRFLGGLALGTAIVAGAGLLDDVNGLRPLSKVLAQLLGASVMVAAGFVPSEVVLGYGTHLHLGAFAIPLLLLWVLAVTNAINLIDGLNGLAGGIAVVACAGAAIVGISNGRWAGVCASLALAGALIGFLRYNFPHAKVFLGDSGSMSVGFILSFVLLRTASEPAGAVIVTVPAFAMMLPFVDTGLAIARRWLRNTPLSGADSRHIHHRLLAMGLSHRKATLVLWGIAGGLTSFGLVIAIAPPVVSWAFSALGSVVLLLVAIYGSNVLSYHELHTAGTVLLTGPRRARRLIQDQIRATDLANRVYACRSSEELDAILDESAAEFGFLHLALISNDSEVSLVLPPLTRQRVWRFEFPIRYSEGSMRGYTLSVWCESDSASRPFGAERVCRILAPAVEQWLSRTGPLKTPVVPMARIPSGSELKIGRVSGERPGRAMHE